MDLLTACLIAEGEQESTEAELIEAWQFLVTTGAVWKLQGWYGRTATSLIKRGLVKSN